jgi:hypothetical protein
MKKDFSIAEALKFGFLSTFDNIPLLFTIQFLRSLFWAIGLATFWVLFYGFVPTYKVLTQSFFYGHGMCTVHDCFDLFYGTKIFFSSLLLALVDIVFLAALIRVGLEIYDTGKGKFHSLISIWPMTVLNLVLLDIVYKSILIVGFFIIPFIIMTVLNLISLNIVYKSILVIGFFIPGIIWAVQFGFCYQVLVDKKMGPLESLRMSALITKGVRWKLFWFWALILAINVTGYALFTVGTLLTMPATLLARIFVYRHLKA